MTQMIKDDRLEFEAHKRDMCLALGRDEATFNKITKIGRAHV